MRCTDVVINNRAGWLNIVHGFLKKGYTPTITNTTTTTYPPTCYIWSTTRLTSKERCAHSAVVGYYMHPSIIPSVSLSNMICLHSFASVFDVDTHDLHNKLHPPHNRVILKKGRIEGETQAVPFLVELADELNTGSKSSSSSSRPCRNSVPIFLLGTCKLHAGTSQESQGAMILVGLACLRTEYLLEPGEAVANTAKTRCTSKRWMVAPNLLKLKFCNNNLEPFEVKTSAITTRVFMILVYLITRRASFEFMPSLKYPSIFSQVYFVPAVIQGVLQLGHSLSGPPHESSSSPT